MSHWWVRPSSIQTDIDRLDLPPSLEHVGHSIRLAGHRTTLIHVLDAIFDGTLIEPMREMFPTLANRKLDEVCAFGEQDIDLMRKYHGEQRAAFAAAEA
jgi:hypothetical protein